MTQTEILQLLNLIKRFDEEELNCNENCYGCYYYMESRDTRLDNCPLLVAYDMVFRKFKHNEQWHK